MPSGRGHHGRHPPRPRDRGGDPPIGGSRERRAARVHLTPDGDLAAGGSDGGPELWPFTQSARRPWRSGRPARVDPVNLLILRTAPEAVLAALDRAGWHRPADGATHRTWVDGHPVEMSDHRALGDRAERSHVRVFRLGTATLGAAHHEVATGRRGRHVVRSWDRAADAVVDALRAQGFHEIAPSGVVTPPDLRGAPGSGRVRRLVGPG